MQAECGQRLPLLLFLPCIASPGPPRPAQPYPHPALPVPHPTQYLAPPHIIVRHGMVEGRVYPQLAAHLSAFLADTLFHTSLLALPSDRLRSNIACFANDGMCRLTEQVGTCRGSRGAACRRCVKSSALLLRAGGGSSQRLRPAICHCLQVVFTDPYFAAEHNRHTSPQLDADVAALHADVAARVAASRLKVRHWRAGSSRCYAARACRILQHGAQASCPGVGSPARAALPPAPVARATTPPAPRPLQEKFVGQQQALLHGDLHTGSIMATGARSRCRRRPCAPLLLPEDQAVRLCLPLPSHPLSLPPRPACDPACMQRAAAPG